MATLIPGSEARTSFFLTLLVQILLTAWPTYVHVSNRRSLEALETLLQGSDVHMSALEGAEIDQRIRQERYLSALYPEPVVNQLLAMPDMIVECAVVQLWTLPLWCLLIAARAGRSSRRTSVRYVRSVWLALATLSAIVLGLSLACTLGTGTSATDAALAGLRVWLTLVTLCSVYLAGLVALPQRRERSFWKWSAHAVALLWFLWSVRASLVAVEAPAADFTPGGLDRYLLSSLPSEVALGMIASAAFTVLFLAIGRSCGAGPTGPVSLDFISATPSGRDTK